MDLIDAIREDILDQIRQLDEMILSGKPDSFELYQAMVAQRRAFGITIQNIEARVKGDDEEERGAGGSSGESD